MNRSLLQKINTPFLFLTLLLMLPPGGWDCAQAEQNAVEDASAKVWVGKKAKAFTLPGIDGKPVNIARDLGKRPVVLVFYRGVW
jgi:hypothetical protein